MKKLQSTSKPFFTLFLEKQEKKEQEELSNDKKETLKGGGRGYQTQKYPSDRDDDIYI